MVNPMELTPDFLTTLTTVSTSWLPPRQATLGTLKYTADDRAGGWDSVQVSLGSLGRAQRNEVPLYIVRKAGEVPL